jgi:hypothetical protein
MCDLREIEAVLRDEKSGLRDRIVRDIGSFTVALFGVFESKEGERLQLGGTGTLVSIAESHYILTARHVWEKVLKAARMVGITLKENTDHRYLMEAREIVPSGPPMPATWDDWGPDLTFLRVPPERVGSIRVHRVFYNLTKRRQTTLDVDHIEARVLMGTPEALGKFTQTHADLQINGLFTHVDPRRETRGDFDYLDFDVDVSFPGLPENFGGVSGGGLWKVMIHCSTSTGEVKWLRILEGVAFHQSALANHHRIIRCHGQQSILAAMQVARPPS